LYQPDWVRWIVAISAVATSAAAARAAADRRSLHDLDSEPRLIRRWVHPVGMEAGLWVVLVVIGHVEANRQGQQQTQDVGFIIGNVIGDWLRFVHDE
jgi:hypothetical protein